MPASSMVCGLASTSSCPSMATLPLSASRMPIRTPISVDLPAPFLPTSPWISPRRTEKSASSSACTPGVGLADPAHIEQDLAALLRHTRLSHRCVPCLSRPPWYPPAPDAVVHCAGNGRASASSNTANNSSKPRLTSIQKGETPMMFSPVSSIDQSSTPPKAPMILPRPP